MIRKSNATTSPNDLAITVIGCGQLGAALIRGFIASGYDRPSQLRATTRSTARAAALSAELGIDVSTDNVSASTGADIVIIAVKPRAVLEVVAEVAATIAQSGALLISVAAAVDTTTIERTVGGVGVIRAMPNLAAVVRECSTCLSRGAHATDRQYALAEELFSSIGRVVAIDEQLFDAVTALSASGPAFVFMVIESLAEGGVRAGLPRDISLELASQTVVGAGAMVLESGQHPAKLKDAVTTPAGCTVDGILELEEGGLRVALIKAVSRAAQRARELASGSP